MSKINPECHRTCLFESVFNHLSDGLVLWDPQFRITRINRAAEQLFGLSSVEMIGRHCGDVFHRAVYEPGCGVPAVPAVLDMWPAAAHSIVCLNSGSGMKRIVVLRTSQIFDSDGKLEGGAATLQHIPDRQAPLTQALVAESAVMLDILSFVRRIASSDAATILLDGENGTGKDVVAKTLHSQSLRQAEPFIAVNCAAIPDTLFESELFGYEAGAFTDARVQKRGIFELADRGTLFLDEVGDIPLTLQAKLLRVLEDQCFRRLGGLIDINLNLRVVAATNRNLREAVRAGTFRQDLYYRLNVIQITIPPLRERADDIQPLARFFIELYNRRFRRSIEGLSDPASQLLHSYDWPGNVRELRNAIERGMILEDSALITSASLPPAIARPDGLPQSGSTANSGTQDQWTALEVSERSLVLRALKQANGNKAQAARLLQVNRERLRHRIRKFNLQ